MAYLCSMSDVTQRFAGVRIDDTVSWHTQTHDQVNLCCRCAVKASSYSSQKGQHSTVWVALDCIEGLHEGHRLAPACVEASNQAQVKHVEGIV